MTDDGGFQARRQEKIEEIRRTGRTWQWPDPVRHRKWTAAHLAVLLSAVLVVVSIVVVLAGM